MDVPPIKSASSASPGPNSGSAAGGHASANINGEVYIADGDYIKDIEVNDLRNRYLLTKSSTQKMVNNIPWLIPTDLHQSYISFRLGGSLPVLYHTVCEQFCLHGSVLARTRIPSVASADLQCLI